MAMRGDGQSPNGACGCRSARTVVGIAVVLGLSAVAMVLVSCPKRDGRSSLAGGSATPAPDAERYWVTATREVDRSGADILAQDRAESGKGLRYRKFFRGDPSRKWAAITFDDGPHPEYTPKLLRILKDRNVKATFFLVGELAERRPDLVRAEVSAGHGIGNHTYHHVNLTKIPVEKVAVEIQACGDVLKSVTGAAPVLFRPPGGDYNRQVALASASLGYTMVLWTDDPGDYASPGEKVIETRVLRAIDNGAVVLVHDGVKETLDVLPRILQILQDRGYRLVTVDEMMASRK